MEDYYLKYAKPINPFIYDNIIQSLQQWHSNAKEELEIYLFLTKEIKNDSLNHYPQNEKVKAFNGIDKFKKVCQFQMQNIAECLIELQRKNSDDIYEEELYSHIEELRKNYNNMLLNNQKFIVSIKFLIEMKHKYLTNKRELQNTQRTINKNHKNLTTNSSKTNIVDNLLNYSSTNEQRNLLNNNNTYNNNNNIKKKRNVDSYLHKVISPYNKLMNYNNNNNIGNNSINNNSNNVSYNKSYNGNDSDKKSIKHSRSFISLNKRKEGTLGLKDNNNNISNNSTIKNVVNTLSSNHYNNKSKVQIENEELKEEIKNIKSQLNIMNETIQLLSEKVVNVQKENNALKQHNQSLINLIEKGLGLNK